MNIVLGTAQIGLKYGITNAVGMPDGDSCRDILQTALSLGLKGFDTAQAYGDSEEKLGQFFASGVKAPIQTKVLPLKQTTLPAKELIESSFKKLKVEKIDVFMFHRFEDVANTQLMNALTWYEEKGRIGKIGCSVNTPQEFKACLAVAEIKFIQFPYNLLDWRWREVGQQVVKSKRADLTLQARSIFLQGLLLGQASQFPYIAGFNAEKLCNEVDSLQKKMGFGSRAELCFSFVFGQSWVNSIVFGVNRASELRDLAKCFKVRPMSAVEMKDVEQIWKYVPEKLLNPSNWS